VVALPVNWAAAELAAKARRWFQHLRGTDGLSRVIRATTDAEIGLSDAEFDGIRRLLEEEESWVQIGRGPVEKLAVMIAACLPDRDPAYALATGRAVARGLLKFAVRDLDPGLFQQVLLARLERMETDQSSALDASVGELHADLASWFAQAEENDAQRLTLVMGQLARVLGESSPGQAGHGEVLLYLATLIRWLNADPWPQDVRLGGPVLTPAAIERKLRVTALSRPDRHEVADADELVSRCERLVILAGPGTGKTWLAKRTARRCAKAALESISAGTAIEDVELPLYITCSQLFSAPGGIREAVLSGVFGNFPDMGGPRVSGALRTFFAERNAPTLLVIDSLDEAGGSDDRLRQADTLPRSWRIVLTSRPGSWNNQLAVDAEDPARRTAELLPLRYPWDVMHFISGWFAREPTRGKDLIAQLEASPALQQASTVPLVLAFYCIIGGAQPLPGRTSVLHAMVIRRMLTGRWRNSSARHDPDPGECLPVLRAWAWSGATKDPVSGTGTWADEIPVSPCTLSPASLEAVDHIAAPVGFRDIDTGMVPRRFVHRSIREHLVAEYMAASMTAEQTARELADHLWYDQDWEYAAPAALARHPERDLVLAGLVSRIAERDRSPDLAVIDGCKEFRRLLVRAAMESSEDDWSPVSADLISQALADLVMQRRLDEVRQAAPGWARSGARVRAALLSLLKEQLPDEDFKIAAESLAMLKPTSEERAQARLKIIEEFDGAGEEEVLVLGAALTALAATDQERLETREILFEEFYNHGLWPGSLVARLDPTPEERIWLRNGILEHLRRETSTSGTKELVDAALELDPTPHTRAEASSVLLKRLARSTDTDYSHIDSTLLIEDPGTAPELARLLISLQVSAAEQARKRKAIFRLLTSSDRDVVRAVASALAGLEPTPQERAQIREALLRTLPGRTGTARQIADVLAELDPPEPERETVLQALLPQLEHQTPDGYGSMPEADRMIKAAIRLAQTDSERAQVRTGIVRLAIRQSGRPRPRLIDTAIKLAVDEHELAATRQVALSMLAGQTDAKMACQISEVFRAVTPTAVELAQARQALLGILAAQTRSHQGSALAEEIGRLQPTAQERTHTLDALLSLLTEETRAGDACHLAEIAAGLELSAAGSAKFRQALLELLTRQDRAADACSVAKALIALQLTKPEQARARTILVGLATRDQWPRDALSLAAVVADLKPGTSERTQLRKALLGQLRHRPDFAREIANMITRLTPTDAEQAQLRKILIEQLAGESGTSACRLARTVASLTPTSQQRAQVRTLLLTLLAGRYDSAVLAALGQFNANDHEQHETTTELLDLAIAHKDAGAARLLVEAAMGPDPTPGRITQGRRLLLDLLDDRPAVGKACRIAEILMATRPATSDLAHVRQVLLTLLGHEPAIDHACQIATAVRGLRPNVQELAQIRKLLLRRPPGEHEVLKLRTLASLNPTAEEQAQIRQGLLREIAPVTHIHRRDKLVATLVSLGPTAPDLVNCGPWAARPATELLTAARRNSALSAWLSALPSLRWPELSKRQALIRSPAISLYRA
jgi:hypothetical protein